MLKYEGDFSDLLHLFESIRDHGYASEINDPVILVKDEKYQKYVVAEGNRRILCLQLIQSNFEFPITKQGTNGFEDENNFFNNVNLDDEKYSSENMRSRVKSNLLSLNKIINELHKNTENKTWTIFYRVVNDGDQLLQILYGKHLVGEKRGMRHWSRSKYYADLLVNFRDGINLNNPDDLKKIKYLNRNPESIITDYKEAQFIYSVFYFENNQDKDEIIYNDEETINRILYNKKPISGLEYNHSYYKTKNVIKDMLKIDDDAFKKDIFDISWDENNKIELAFDKKISPPKMFNFLYTNWRENKVNTRGIKNANAFEEDINNYLINDVNFDQFLTKDELEKINEFEISEEVANKIITINEYKYPNDIKRFKIAKNINKKRENFSEYFKSINDPKELKDFPYHEVFNILLMQYNDTKKKYINSLAATIRTFIEQLFIWLSVINDLEFSDSGYTFSEEHPTKDDYYNVKSGKGMQKRYKDAKKDFLNKIFNLINCIKFLYKNGTDNLPNKHAEFLKSNIKDVDDVLNEFIHASHRIYKSDSYIHNLEILEKWQNFMYEVYTSIDFTKFKKITKKDN